MQIKDMFEKKIDRDIKGVIKVGQSDEENVYQELDEYVVTKELLKHFRDFFDNYEKGINNNTDKMGVWISGFFGSGKSHFLKILSYLLKNSVVEGKRAIEYFTDGKKIEDPMLIARMTNSGTISSDVMLFNIDSKGSAKVGSGKEAIVEVFMKVFNEECFSDDIVGRFIEFIKTVYSPDTLEENLDYIAKALGNKGDTSREVLRNYFLKDFYADHLKIYQKRPIYWLFDSGKQNGFKALIYMHRYDADTVGRVRTDYLHRAQKYVETAMQSAQYTIDNASSASEKSKATKAVTKYTKQLAEMKIYDEAIAHIANKRIEINLDDGVKVNYAKFQGVEVAQEGKKALKVDLLAKIK